MRNCFQKNHLAVGLLLLGIFVLWTVAVCTVNVQAIGPEGSSVGLAGVNRFFHALTGVHMPLYVLTDWLSLVAIGLMLSFALLGLCQWIRRGSLRKVDGDILALGGFYLAVLVVYLLFEGLCINWRPVLIHGVLEASYPSSTTMLVLCVGSTAVMQLKRRIPSKACGRWVCAGLMVYMAGMVLLRMVSGVHWLSDIVGGVLLSGGLVFLYRWVCGRCR